MSAKDIAYSYHCFLEPDIIGKNKVVFFLETCSYKVVRKDLSLAESFEKYWEQAEAELCQAQRCLVAYEVNFKQK